MIIIKGGSCNYFLYLPRIELSAVGVDAHKEQLCLAECHWMVVGWLVMQLSSGGCNQMCHRQIVTRSIHQETPQRRRSKVCHCGYYINPKLYLLLLAIFPSLSLLTLLWWWWWWLCAHTFTFWIKIGLQLNLQCTAQGTIAVTQILVHSFTDKCKICAKLIKLDRSCVTVREREGGKE